MIDGEREIRLGDDDSQEERRRLFAAPHTGMHTGGASSNGRRVRLLSVVVPSLLLATFSASFFIIEKSGPWPVGNVAEKQQDPEDSDDNQGNSSNTWPPLHFIDNLFTSDDEPRRLVVAAANSGYADFADNFANHLLLLNVTNFVLLPLDNEAFRLLHVAYPNHTLPVLPGLATSNVTLHQAARFGTKNFKILTSTRPSFLRSFLEQNVAVFYNDIDMVWKQNAWDVLDRMDNTPSAIKLWEDEETSLCSCIMYLPPTRFSFEFLDAWEAEIRTKNHSNDQPAMNKAASALGIDHVWKSHEANKAVQIYANSDEFPSGTGYFEVDSGDKSKVVIIHNNWIVGKRSKIDRFQEHGLWNLSGRLPQTKGEEFIPLPWSLGNWKPKVNATVVRRSANFSASKTSSETQHGGNKTE